MSTDRVAYQRAYQGARQRALNRLAALHRGEYAALLAAERATDEGADPIALLERERVRRPDDLESERYAPAPAERGYWNHPTDEQDDD